MIKEIITLQRIFKNPDTEEILTTRVAIDLLEIVQIEEYPFDLNNFEGYGPICYIDTFWVRGQMFTVSYDKMLVRWKRALDKKRVIVNLQINN